MKKAETRPYRMTVRAERAAAKEKEKEKDKEGSG